MHIHNYLEKYDSLAYEDYFYNIPQRKEYILSKIGKAKRVLDVGCLGGKFSLLIKSQNNEVFGLELNPVAAALAEKKGIRVKIADVEEGIPFDSESFDVVNAGEVIEYIYDTKNFFDEARRVLKRKGLFLFTIRNVNSLENRIRIAVGQYPQMVGAYPEDHFGDSVRIFNLSKIKELCYQTKFKLLETQGVLALESHGKWMDHSLAWLGKLAPKFSKLMIVAAQKEK
jgi:SAM-dependent methyltransferase